MDESIPRLTHRHHPTRLFVYGTLRKGYYNYERFQLSKNAHHQGTTLVRAARMYNLGTYPCMVLSPDRRHKVTGELLDIQNTRILSTIWRMEEAAGYQPKVVETERGPAITFVFGEPPEGVAEVVSGDWAEAS